MKTVHMRLYYQEEQMKKMKSKKLKLEKKLKQRDAKLKKLR